MKSSLNVLLAAVFLVSLPAKSQDGKERYSDQHFGGYVLTKDVSYGARNMGSIQTGSTQQEVPQGQSSHSISPIWIQ